MTTSLCRCFFHDSFSPGPLIIPFPIFFKIQRFFPLKVYHRCQRHRWQTEKLFTECFFILGTGSSIHLYTDFLLSLQFKVKAICSWHRGQLDAGIVDTMVKWPPVSLQSKWISGTPVVNLPQKSRDTVPLKYAQICTLFMQIFKKDGQLLRNFAIFSYSLRIDFLNRLDKT